MARTRRLYAFKKVGVYRSKRKRYDGKPVYQLTKNKGTGKGLFKKGKGNRKSYIPNKYKKNAIKT